jgi:hypothetical protein
MFKIKSFWVWKSVLCMDFWPSQKHGLFNFITTDIYWMPVTVISIDFMFSLIHGRKTYKLNVYINTYTILYIYIDRENKIVSVSLSKRTTGGREGKKMLQNEKYWNNPSLNEYNIRYHTANCWILGEHGDRETVSNAEVNGIEAWYIQAWNTKVKSAWAININQKYKST